eukprot:jgi/Psemu1/287880/fgenesh1_pg.219_\
MCRLTSDRKGCDIHVVCQDRNCSVKNIRQLISEYGTEILEKKDVYGRVPLFYALRRRCSLPVVQTLLDSGPNAILQHDFCGELPLYMLFHSNADYRILEFLLNRKPSLALYQENRFSGAQSLLQRLCIQWEDAINALRPSSSASSSSEMNDDYVGGGLLSRNLIESDSKLCNQWAKLVLMVRAAYSIGHITAVKPMKSDAATISDADNSEKLRPSLKALSHETSELHMVMQLVGIPPTIICQFIEMYPEQASLPISTATTEPILDSVTGANRAACRITNASACSGMLPLHFFLACYSSTKPAPGSVAPSDLFAHHQKRATVLRSLLRAFPEATALRQPSRCDRHECHRLPLHVAIANGISWSNGLEEVVCANPSALALEDEHDTRLPPFLQQASTSAGTPHPRPRPRPHQHSDPHPHPHGDSTRIIDEGDPHLTTMYCLLREDPSVLSRLAPSLLPS